jgi:hypothetical protein
MARWFKHYIDADTSKDLGPLLEILGLEGYARYWLLLELLFEHFDGTQTEFKIPTSRVLNKLKMRSKRGLTRFKTGLNQFTTRFEIDLTEHFVVFKTSICAELLHRDFKKARSERGQPAPKIKNKDIDKDTDKEKENKKKSSNSLRSHSPQAEKIAELWNAKSGRLPKIRVPVSNARRNKILSRLKEFPAIEDWETAIAKMAASDFCNGLNNQSWVATFDFLLRPESIEKVLEGKYDNRHKLDRKMAGKAELWRKIRDDEL